MGQQPIGARHLPDRFEQAGLAEVERRGTEGGAAIGVAQRDRLHSDLRRERGLQQVGVERQQQRPSTGRSFRKDGDARAGPQRIGHLMDDTQCIALALALDEQRAATGDHEAEQRPLPHVGLRHEAHRPPGVDREDVEPGHMVREQQHRRRLQRADGF